MNSCVYEGTIWHHRHAPRPHRFRYDASIFLLDLDELDLIVARTRGFGHNRAAAISFHDRDYLGGGRGPLKARLAAFLADEGVDLAGGRVALLTQCRTFGYVFNPISLYFCHAPAGDLLCIVAEVRNTFGERVLYRLDDRARVASGATGVHRYLIDKAMHVSPFLSMACSYDFRIVEPADRLSVTIVQHERGLHLLDAGISATRVALTSSTLARLLVRYPWQTARITAAIHWQAFRLWRKRLPVFPQPAPSRLQDEQAQQLRAIERRLDGTGRHV